MVQELTLVVVKPDATEVSDDIANILRSSGLVITFTEAINTSESTVREIYSKSSSNDIFQQHLSHLTSASCSAIGVYGDNAIAACREICGPDDPAEARDECPMSVRARYGTSVVKNAVYTPASSIAANRDLNLYFPYIPGFTPKDAGDAKYVAASVAPLLMRALTELCAARPADPADWLASYMWNDVKDQNSARTQPQTSQGLPKIYFILGNAGSGKGTQSAKLVEKYGFAHLSAGDLLRAEVEAMSPEGNRIFELIKEGQIVPGEITVRLLKKAIHHNRQKPGILIDGFPRELKQAALFEKMVSDFEFAIFFDCPEDVLTERLLSRGRSSGRVDDNLACIRKRFDTFKRQSTPVVEYYEAKGKLHRIDGTRPADDIFQQISALFSG